MCVLLICNLRSYHLTGMYSPSDDSVAYIYLHYYILDNYSRHNNSNGYNWSWIFSFAFCSRSAWLITHAPKPVSGLLSITHAQMSLHVAGVKHIISYRMQKTVQFRNVSTLKQETFNSIDRRIMSSMSRIARVGSRILSAASGRSGSAATGEI